ncbi:hypothetical protein FGIG_04755 [Fasciola gigantica]|uniref:Uncharacterized protein n=1 Tax=Fasciola gigantica TaxID=46835 RepID=A0A504WV74_FASGI|nr:hypothetical protein FGIG_04755 [Fasciola gigantica]
MGLLARILMMVASGVGVVCCLGALIQYRDTINAQGKTDIAKGAIACLFISLFIFAGTLLFLFITLCCSCGDIIMGIITAVAGGSAAVFAIIAFGLVSKPRTDAGLKVPDVGEWMFACIATGISVILVALTMAVE